MPKDRKRAPRVDVVTREFTINLHKRLHGVYVTAELSRAGLCSLLWLLCDARGPRSSVPRFSAQPGCTHSDVGGRWRAGCERCANSGHQNSPPPPSRPLARCACRLRVVPHTVLAASCCCVVHSCCACACHACCVGHLRLAHPTLPTTDRAVVCVCHLFVSAVVPSAVPPVPSLRSRSSPRRLWAPATSASTPA